MDKLITIIILRVGSRLWLVRFLNITFDFSKYLRLSAPNFSKSGICTPARNFLYWCPVFKTEADTEMELAGVEVLILYPGTKKKNFSETQESFSLQRTECPGPIVQNGLFRDRASATALFLQGQNASI